MEASRKRALPSPPELDAPRSDVLAPAVDDALVIEVEYEDVPPLAKRAEQRLTYQEAKRQLNVENVVREAAEELEGVIEVSDEPVDDDWTARFFGHVQDVSNEQMRKLWAKILAGEVVRPGSFSLRALETLRNMSHMEAELFFQIAKLATRSGAVVDTARRDYLLPLDTAMTLSEAGLLTTPTPMSFGIDSTKEDRFESRIYFRDVALRITHSSPMERLGFQAWAMSNVGIELASVLIQESDRAHVRAVADLIREHGVTVTMHLITGVGEEDQAYNPTPIE